jgi:hypothetical protein
MFSDRNHRVRNDMGKPLALRHIAGGAGKIKTIFVHREKRRETIYADEEPTARKMFSGWLATTGMSGNGDALPVATPSEAASMVVATKRAGAAFSAIAGAAIGSIQGRTVCGPCTGAIS